jgi:hypothetical protein
MALGSGGDTIYLHPANGADTNSGAKDSPLRTLAEAARRVNGSEGTGAVTIVLAEGVYAVGETTLLKPEHRSFSQTERLTVRAEVLPDDPGWHIGRMPMLVHTMPIPPAWNGRPDPLGGAAERLRDRDQPRHHPGPEDPRHPRGREPAARADPPQGRIGSFLALCGSPGRWSGPGAPLSARQAWRRRPTCRSG